MWRGELTTPWIGDGLSDDTANRPALSSYLASQGEKFEDVTGQPTVNLHPAPNLYAVYFEVEAATLDLIEADSTYFVVWAEEIPPEVI